MKERKTESGDSQGNRLPKWPLFSYVEDSRFSVDFSSTFAEPISKYRNPSRLYNSGGRNEELHEAA
jgi:hypothetical protein